MTGCTGEMLGYKAGEEDCASAHGVMLLRAETALQAITGGRPDTLLRCGFKGVGKDYQTLPIGYYTLGEEKWHYAADLPLDNQAIMELSPVLTVYLAAVRSVEYGLQRAMSFTTAGASNRKIEGPFRAG